MNYEDMVQYSGAVALLIFMTTFALVLWWALRPSAKKRFDLDAEIPFKED